MISFKKIEDEIKSEDTQTAEKAPSYHAQAQTPEAHTQPKKVITVDFRTNPPPEIPANADTPKRKVKIFAISAPAILVIVLIGWLIWFFAFRNAAPQDEAIEIPTTTAPTWTEQEALFYARRILELLDTQRDEFGFNTSSSECIYENGSVDCVPIFTIEPTESQPIRSAFRETIPVIWANFKLFERTEDTGALRRMEEGIDALITYVIDTDNYILQTDRFNCALMRDIANSPMISQEYRDRANYVCLGGSMEYFNRSFTESLDTLTEDEMLAQIPVLENQISHNLSIIDGGGAIVSDDNFNNSTEVSYRLLTQLFALLNLDFENQATAQFVERHDLMHKRTMMFLDETIQWYFTNYEELGPSEYCLMMGVLDIHAPRLGFPGFSQATGARFQNYANQNDNRSAHNVLICSFMDYYTDNDNFDKGEIVDLMRWRSISETYLGNFNNDDHILNTFINALAAGLLAV